MRVVFLNPVGVIGGAEQVLLHMLAGLRLACPDVRPHLIVAAEGPLGDQARRHQVAVTVLPMPAALAALGDSFLPGGRGLRKAWDLARRAVVGLPAARRYLRDLRQVLQRLSPDLIHSNGIKTHLLAALVAARPVPVIWHIHDFYGCRPLAARGLRWARTRVAGAIAVSEAVARDASAVLPGLPITVVPNAIDVSRFAPGDGDGPTLDRLAGLPLAEPGTVRVGLVATYGRWKGQDVFLEAAARVLRGHRRADAAPLAPVRFYLIGGPIYRTGGSQFSEQELRGRAGALALADRVGFIGFQEETVSVYRGLDIVVQASTRPEPFGLTIIEAMACAKPVIIARAGGAAELFRPDHDAVAVPPGDVAALAAAVERLAADRGLRDALGLQARLTVLQRYAWERLGPQLLAVYRRSLGAASPVG
jgi:glycosyltransferase involved in cell wall biosynthesis